MNKLERVGGGGRLRTGANVWGLEHLVYEERSRA